MSAPLTSYSQWQANRAESIARGVACVMCGEPVLDAPGHDIWFNEDATMAYGRCDECTARIEAEIADAWRDSLAPATSALGAYTIYGGQKP